MKNNHLRSALLIGFLIAVTCSALAYSKIHENNPAIGIDQQPVITLHGQVPQSKVMINGDGNITMGITISAQDIKNPEEQQRKPVDLIIVFDRSGSMQGDKLHDAQKAIVNIIDSMRPNDRLGILSYSDHVVQHNPLIKMTRSNKNIIKKNVHGIRASGGTNLGSGLQEAIRMVKKSNHFTGSTKIILISDGMANQGITNPTRLGKIARQVSNYGASISTIGVGIEFNENLMTDIADQGSGIYYFLEDPMGFADIFHNELSTTKLTAASGIEIRIPLEKDMLLADAAGYPIENKNGVGTFRPGNLIPGQSRTFYITLQIPTEIQRTYSIKNITAHYLQNGHNTVSTLPESFTFSCIENPKEVLSSINKDIWEKKVLQDDINKLRADVAQDIGTGKKDTALKRISTYKAEQKKVNSFVGSTVVDEAIKDLDILKEEVHQTFTGTPSAVVMKQKKASKSLQHKSYEGRRSIH